MTTDNNLELQEKIIIASVCKSSLTDVVIGKIRPNKSQQAKIHQKIELLKQDYPLDYLLEGVKINDLYFKLNQDVLIPREETENWVNLLIRHSSPFDLLEVDTVVDLGTGSGFIGLSLAKYCDKIILTDVSKEALRLAKFNAKNNNLNNLLFFQSDLLSNPRIKQTLKNITWGLVANLPYLPLVDKVAHQNTSVRYEPDLALYSGDDGLDLFRRLLLEIGSINLPSFAVFELDSRNILEAEIILVKMFDQISLKTYIWQDLWGRNRVLVCKFDNTI